MVNEAAGAFSANFEPISEAKAAEFAKTAKPGIGHQSTADVLKAQLGLENSPFGGRVNVSLNKGDSVLLAQFRGDRLPEGATTLPEGARIQFFVVTVV
jgi:hypothetical protein